MSAMANTTPLVTTVTKPATNPRDADATPRINIQEFCEEYYEDILPIIMDKVFRDRRKDVHTRRQVERWAMPTWCHMFNSTLIGAAKVWFDELRPESINSYKDLKTAFLAYFMQQKKYVKDSVEIHNIKQKDGEIIEDFMERFKVETERMKGTPECMRISGFMHGVNNLELIKRLNEHVPKTMEEMMITTTAFIRGEAAAASKKKVTHHGRYRTSSKGKLQTKGLTFEVTQGKEMDLTGSLPLQGRQKRFLQPRRAPGNNRRRRSFHKSMDEFHDFEGRIVTIRSIILIPTECTSVITSSSVSKEERTRPDNFKVALHPDFPDQEVAIGGTLSGKGHIELCSILKKNLDIFAWKPSYMKGVPRSVDKHQLNIREGYLPVRDHERGLLPRLAIQSSHGKETRRQLMDVLRFHRFEQGLSAGFYPLSKIDWKVESLCGYPFKCFLDAYKGCHQIQVAESNKEKTTFHTGQGMYCYTKMHFGLKNAGATYQRLMEKAFDSQIG
nr:reverse transcriptase domain-containing protein [Tanacetum cinerariifolium]